MDPLAIVYTAVVIGLVAIVVAAMYAPQSRYRDWAFATCLAIVAVFAVGALLRFMVIWPPGG